MLTWLTKTLHRWAMKAPLSTLYKFGVVIGLVMHANPRKRRNAYKNIKMCFPEKSYWEISQITRRCFKSIGLSFIEMMTGPRLIDKVIVRGKENLLPGNHIFVGIHQASWELYNYVLAAKMKFAVLVKTQKPPQLDRFINNLRQENKVMVCRTIKDLLRALKDNWTIGTVVDTGAEDNAPDIEFFGHPIPTPQTSLMLARKMNKEVYPCRGFRVEGFTHIVEIGKPIDLTKTSDLDALNQINQYYENHIKEHTWQYLWAYKRFKHKKDLNILLLNDGKIGHLKQSQALISFFKEIHPLVRVTTIDVTYNSKITRLLTDIIGMIIPKFAPKVITHLPLLVNQSCAQSLAKTYADIVISCGSAMAGLNRIMASSLYAKSVSILRPNIPVSKLDLCLIPAHDRISHDRAVNIKGALVYPDLEQKKAKQCQEFFKISPGTQKLAVFIGGSVANTAAFNTNLKVLIKHLIDYSVKNNYKLLVTTSRRTSLEAERFLETELRKHPQVEALVIANKQNHDFIFEGFVSLAKACLVTAESISMVSEIASSSKPCICVPLEILDDKRLIFLESLGNDIQILKSPYNISNISFTESKLFQENKTIITQAIKKIL